MNYHILSIQLKLTSEMVELISKQNENRGQNQKFKSRQHLQDFLLNHCNFIHNKFRLFFRFSDIIDENLH